MTDKMSGDLKALTKHRHTFTDKQQIMDKSETCHTAGHTAHDTQNMDFFIKSNPS
jgi:hypothetical protein